MTHVRLQAQLAESKAEIQKLRERMPMGTPTVHKDLSLISLVPKCSGLESAVPLEDSAQIGRWEQADKLRIDVLKLTDSAKMFYNACPELHGQNATWEEFKRAFRKRVTEVHSDQYNFMKLQTARQGKDESPQEFADRCRGLAQKIIVKTDYPVAQRIHRENAERMLLASFVAGLSGVTDVR